MINLLISFLLVSMKAKTIFLQCIGCQSFTKDRTKLDLLQILGLLLILNLLNYKLHLIEWTFKRALKNYVSLYLACNVRKAFSQSVYTLVMSECVRRLILSPG